jgi:hypothetical protein
MNGLIKVTEGQTATEKRNSCSKHRRHPQSQARTTHTSHGAICSVTQAERTVTTHACKHTCDLAQRHTHTHGCTGITHTHPGIPEFRLQNRNKNPTRQRHLVVEAGLGWRRVASSSLGTGLPRSLPKWKDIALLPRQHRKPWPGTQPAFYLGKVWLLLTRVLCSPLPQAGGDWPAVTCAESGLVRSVSPFPIWALVTLFGNGVIILVLWEPGPTCV